MSWLDLLTLVAFVISEAVMAAFGIFACRQSRGRPEDRNVVYLPALIGEMFLLGFVTEDFVVRLLPRDWRVVPGLLVFLIWMVTFGRFIILTRRSRLALAQEAGDAESGTKKRGRRDGQAERE